LKFFNINREEKSQQRSQQAQQILELTKKQELEERLLMWKDISNVRSRPAKRPTGN